LAGGAVVGRVVLLGGAGFVGVAGGRGAGFGVAGACGFGRAVAVAVAVGAGRGSGPGSESGCLKECYLFVGEMGFRQWRTYHRTKGSVSPQIFEKKYSKKSYSLA